MVNVFSVILCAQAVCDNGQVHLMSVLHKLAAQTFPTEPITLDLFMMATRDGGPKNQLEVRISPPDVTVGPSVVGKVDVTSPPGEVSILSCRIMCKYGAPGTYFFDVFCDKELIGQTKLIMMQDTEAKLESWKPEGDGWTPLDES